MRERREFREFAIVFLVIFVLFILLVPTGAYQAGYPSYGAGIY